MREYRIGEEIAFRNTPDAPLVWARVVDVRTTRAGVVECYWVRADNLWDSELVKVHPTQVGDLASVSAQASAALDRIYRQDREKAMLLDELLGALSYYAKCGGQIHYTPSTVGKRYQAQEPVQDLVDAYMVKRDRVHRQS